MTDLDRLAAGERLEVVRQFIGARHDRAAHQHRHHADVALQGGAGLEADEVVGIIEPPASCGIGGRRPLVADDDDEHLAGTDRRLDRGDEIDPGLDSLDIHEDAIGTEMRRQAVVDPARIAGRVVTSIADEDSVHAVHDSLAEPDTAPGS